MNRDPILFRQSLVSSHALRGGFACVALLLCFSRAMMGQTPSAAQGATTGSVVQVTHLLGLEDVRNNTKGDLSIHDRTLQFQRDGSTAAQVSISSIQDISLGSEDRQMGGVPMTLGKAAVPFEGGRAISLFSHKKYDTLTVEYLDNNGGFHAAIFEMNAGQGASLETDLVANGAHIASPELGATQSTPEVNTPEVKQ